ncbi:hypothetical protein D3C74_292330 [compost metagenome]
MHTNSAKGVSLARVLVLFKVFNLYSTHGEDHLVPVTAVQLTNLHPGLTPGVDESAVANVNSHMSRNFIVLKSSWNREEDEIPDLEIGSVNARPKLSLIPRQSWEGLTKLFEYMLGEGGAVKCLGLLIRLGTEFVRYTQIFFSVGYHFFLVIGNAKNRVAL